MLFFRRRRCEIWGREEVGSGGEGGLYHASLLCVPRFQASHVRLGPTPSVSSVKERGCSGGGGGGGEAVS